MNIQTENKLWAEYDKIRFYKDESSVSMDNYYRKLVKAKQADEFKNGIAIFNIGEDDRVRFPDLSNVDQLWILLSGKIQLIYNRAISGVY